MRDVRSLVREVDRAPAPDLWSDVRTRDPRPMPPEQGLRDRPAVVLVTLALTAAAMVFVFEAFRTDGTSMVDVPTVEPVSLMGTPRVTAEIPLPGDPVTGGIAVSAGSAWVGSQTQQGTGDTAVLRIDLATDQIVATIPVRDVPWRNQIVATDDVIWVGSRGVVERIDPATNAVTAQIFIADRSVTAMAVDEVALWVVAIGSDGRNQNVGSVLKIDPSTNSIVAEIPLGDSVTGYNDEILSDGASVWVLGSRLIDDDTEDGGDLVRIDAATNAVVASIPVDGFDMVMAADGIWVWSPLDGLFDQGAGKEWRWVIVDKVTNEPSRPFIFDAPLVLVTPGALWSAGYDENTNGRVASYDPDTLDVMSRSEPIRSLFHQAIIDPATRTAWFAAIDSVYRVDIE